MYKSAVELALADGRVTAPEAEKLDSIRRDLGLGEMEAAAIHRALGWHDEVPSDVGSRSPASSEDSPLRQFLLSVQERLNTLVSRLDDEVGINRGELWLPLGNAQEIAVWFSRKRSDSVQVAVGFYSRHRRRDPDYRNARQRLQGSSMPVPRGWKPWTKKSRREQLAWETRRMARLDELTESRVADQVADLALELRRAGQVALQPVDLPQEELPADDEEFELRPLEGKPRYQESVWLPRILWALEWGRRNAAGPMSAADIARVLSANGVIVPPTNTARAFRTERDDPRRSGLCEEHASQCYTINDDGRAALREFLRLVPTS